MGKYSEKRAKKNEQKALDLLNAKYGEFKMATGKYSEYDIFGRDNSGIPILIECKERSQWWPHMWIEKAKLISIFNIGKQNPKKNTQYFLICNVGDEFLLYDMKCIWRDGKTQIREMNDKTAFGDQNKVNKEVISFRQDNWVLNLTTGETCYECK